MKNEKLIPFFIEDDETDFPIRGGKYVSEETKKQEELQKIRKKLSECNCDCNCNCDDDNCDCNW